MANDLTREAHEAIAKARTILIAMCSGERKWGMSIPAQPDYDPDLVIGAALAKADEALRACAVSATGPQDEFLKAVERETSRLGPILRSDPAPETPAGKELLLLSELVEQYERVRFNMKDEQQGYKS